MKADHDTISAPLLEEPSAVRADPIAGLRDLETGRIHDLALSGGRFVIGSDPRHCDVVLSDRYISKVHCVLERQGSRLVARDCDSKNGVTLDGVRVEACDVRPGSVLRVGATALVALSARALSGRTTLDSLVGEHPRFLDAVEKATRAGSAAAECSVLILGETGTGKELFARLIHETSRRDAGPYVALNCGALTTDLLGSELFGHIRGSFTGAVDNRAGVFVAASGGTLFLDEIGELPLEQQPHLLRVLETQRVRPIGSTEEREVDVRFVAATNRLDPLGSQILRADLFHRIATVVIELPPLRERASDIPLLVEAFIRDESDRPRYLRDETMAALIDYPWPGNVRELRYAVIRALAMCGDELTLDELLPESPINLPRPRPAPEPPKAPADPADYLTYDERVVEMLRQALAEHGSMRRAAKALDMPRSTFADRLRRYSRKVG